MRNQFPILLTFLILLIFSVANGQDKNIEQGELLPRDPKTRYGKLASGFTYYIRENADPGKMIVIYFAVEAGHMQEDEDQIELSHVLEHVGFKGTVNFPRGVYHYLEKYGLTRGSYLNANTGYDVTVYKISVPASNPEALDTGLRIARDLADRILLRPEDIEIERQAVLAESIRSSGLSQRISDQTIPRLLGKSNYALRGIGSNHDESVRNFSHSSLIRFYKDWYRPDLQAIMIAGDIDPDTVEQNIQTLFNDLVKRDKPRNKMEYPAFVPGENQWIVACDTSMEIISINVYMKHPSHYLKTFDDLRFFVIMGLYNDMAKRRFSELQDQYDPPFNTGTNMFYQNGGPLVNGIDVLLTSLTVDSIKNIERGFKAAMTEIARIAKHGFTEEELEQSRKDILSSMPDTVLITSDNLLKYSLNHFLYAEAILDPKWKTSMTKKFINEITLTEVNTIARDVIKDDNRDILIMAPEALKDSLPSETDISRYLEEVKNNKFPPYAPKAVKELLPFTPSSSGRKKMKVTVIKELGASEIQIPAGAKLILKPFKPAAGMKSDKLVLLHGFRPGGAALYSGLEYHLAVNAPGIIEHSGVGNLNKFELTQLLEDKNISVSPYMDDFRTGIKARATKANIETMLQVVHQYFVSPARSNVAFESWKSHQKRLLKNSEPGDIFLDTIARVTREQTLRTSLENLDRLELTAVFDIYKERFGNASDFIFVLTGDFDPNEIIPLLKKYLGSLPSRLKSIRKKNGSMGFPKSGVDKTIYNGRNKAEIALRLPGIFEYNAENIAKLDALNWILQQVLTERLREVEKGVYGVSTNVKYSKLDKGHFIFSISFSCAPDRTNDLISASLNEVLRLRKSTIDLALLETYKRIFAHDLQRKTNSNIFWSDYLSQEYQDTADPKALISQINYIRNLTVLSIQSAANEYLIGDNVMKFILLPENLKFYLRRNSVD